MGALEFLISLVVVAYFVIANSDEREPGDGDYGQR